MYLKCAPRDLCCFLISCNTYFVPAYIYIYIYTHTHTHVYIRLLGLISNAASSMKMFLVSITSYEHSYETKYNSMLDNFYFKSSLPLESVAISLCVFPPHLGKFLSFLTEETPHTSRYSAEPDTQYWNGIKKF